MFRPICAVGQTISQSSSQVFKRSKVIAPPSILSKADRLKLWHKENKELFGPILETNKQKKARLQKTGKCTCVVSVATFMAHYFSILNAFDDYYMTFNEIFVPAYMGASTFLSPVVKCVI